MTDLYNVKYQAVFFNLDHLVCSRVILLFVPLPPSFPPQYMPAAAAAPMQGTYIPQYTAVPASAITVEVRTKSASLLTLVWFVSLTLQGHHRAGLAGILTCMFFIL